MTIKKFPTNNSTWSDPYIINLEGIAVGDELMINQAGRWDNCSNYTKIICKKVTPKQAVIGERRYWIKNASLVGECGYPLMNADEQIILKSRTERQLYALRRKLADMDWAKLNDKTILDITTLIDKETLREPK